MAIWVRGTGTPFGPFNWKEWNCPNCLNKGRVVRVDTGPNYLNGMAVTCECGWSVGFDPRQIGPEKPIEQTLLAEPITAYRGWAVRRPDSYQVQPSNAENMKAMILDGEDPFNFHVRLFAIAADAPGWEKVEHATCLSNQFNNAYSVKVTSMGSSTNQYLPGLEKHEAPHRTCMCGIWALKTEEAVIKALREQYYKVSGVTWAYGEVRMWGRFFEHKLGFRAEYAQPMRLWLSVRDEEIANELSEYYGCPVEFMDEEIAKPEPKGEMVSFSPGGMVSPVNLTYTATTNSILITPYLTSVTGQSSPTPEIEILPNDRRIRGFVLRISLALIAVVFSCLSIGTGIEVFTWVAFVLIFLYWGQWGTEVFMRRKGQRVRAT